MDMPQGETETLGFQHLALTDDRLLKVYLSGALATLNLDLDMEASDLAAAILASLTGLPITHAALTELAAAININRLDITNDVTAALINSALKATDQPVSNAALTELASAITSGVVQTALVSGRAYSDPIRLTLPNGNPLVMAGTTELSQVIDREGYNTMSITHISGAMSGIQARFCDTPDGTFQIPFTGISAAGTVLPNLALGTASTYRREITVGAGYCLGGRYVQFEITGTDLAAIAVDVVLSTL